MYFGLGAYMGLCFWGLRFYIVLRFWFVRIQDGLCNDRADDSELLTAIHNQNRDANEYNGLYKIQTLYI